MTNNKELPKSNTFSAPRFATTSESVIWELIGVCCMFSVGFCLGELAVILYNVMKNFPHNGMLELVFFDSALVFVMVCHKGFYFDFYELIKFVFFQNQNKTKEPDDAF